MRFTDKVVLVTGAASGIGLAAAQRFAEEGGLVAVNDLDLVAVNRVVEEIRAAGGAAVPLPGDVSDREWIEDAAERVISEHGAVDVLVNNAGVASHGEAETYDAWERVLSIDLSAPYYLARTVARRSMIPRRQGAIVNVSSLAGLVGNPFDVGYVSAKHGVVGLTKALSIEWARYNVRVNCLCPGHTMTPILAAVEAREPGKFAARAAKVPLGRAAKPHEQAAAIVFLASDEASFITGTIMPVDGGQMALSSGWNPPPMAPL